MTQIEIHAGDAPRMPRPSPRRPGRARHLRKLAARIAVPVIRLRRLHRAVGMVCRAYQVPHYILPAPDPGGGGRWCPTGRSCPRRWEVTLGMAPRGAGRGAGRRVLLAVLFIQSRWLELALYPYAVVLQVTPIVAIAPLIIIYAPSTESVLLICASSSPSSRSCRT